MLGQNEIVVLNPELKAGGFGAMGLAVPRSLCFTTWLTMTQSSSSSSGPPGGSDIATDAAAISRLFLSSSSLAFLAFSLDSSCLRFRSRASSEVAPLVGDRQAPLVGDLPPQRAELQTGDVDVEWRQLRLQARHLQQAEQPRLFRSVQIPTPSRA